MLVRGREPDLQLVPELLRFKAKHDSFRRFLALIANALPSGPEHAGRAAFLGDGSRQLPLRRARHQDQGVVKIGLSTTVRAGEDINGLQFQVQVPNRPITVHVDLLDHGLEQYQKEADADAFSCTSPQASPSATLPK